MVRNWYSFIGFVNQIFITGVFIYLIYKQWREVKRPNNGFRILRKRILYIFVVSLLAISLRTLPVYRSMMRGYTPTFEPAASLATTAILFSYSLSWLLTYTYKERK